MENRIEHFPIIRDARLQSLKGRLFAGVERPRVTRQRCIHFAAHLLQAGAICLGARGIPLQQIIARKRTRLVQRRPDLLQGAIADQERLPDLDIMRLDLAQGAQRVDSGEQHQSEHAAKTRQQNDLRAPLERLHAPFENHGVFGFLRLHR